MTSDSLDLSKSISSRNINQLLMLALFLTSLVISYWSTVSSMVAIWYRSDTFAHGFIIAPISAWLIWRQRNFLTSVNLEWEWRFLIPLAGSGFLWLLGYLVNALVVQHLAFVCLIIFGVLAFVGLEVGRRLAFPLFFLLLMVPMGEDLIAPMMEFTATSTVKLIQLSGIPVYREGLYFSLPSGNWSVVEACSGVRYLIASVTLGILYAHLNYVSWKKQILFVMISIIVPVFANSGRAYLIVMVGHFSDMQHAVGADHLIYGWFFFGIVIMALFWVGSFFADEMDVEKEMTANNQSNKVISSIFVSTFSIVFISLVWSQFPRAFYVTDEKSSVVIKGPNVLGLSPLKADPWSWQPKILGADRSLRAHYDNDGTITGVYVNLFISQNQGSELVSSQDTWTSKKDRLWRLKEKSSQSISLPNRSIPVEQAVVTNDAETLLIWRWYRLGNVDVTNTYSAKLLEAFSTLTMRETPAARIYFAVKFEDDIDAAQAALTESVESILPLLVLTDKAI